MPELLTAFPPRSVHTFQSVISPFILSPLSVLNVLIRHPMDVAPPNLGISGIVGA